MAYIIGLETEENIKDLVRRGYKAEAAPESLRGTEFSIPTSDQEPRMVQFWVDAGVFDIMNGVWEDGE